jgi:hypothetical protein
MKNSGHADPSSVAASSLAPETVQFRETPAEILRKSSFFRCFPDHFEHQRFFRDGKHLGHTDRFSGRQGL